MRRLFLTIVVLFLLGSVVPVRAQDDPEPPTAREVIEAMGTPQEGGIPNSYLTDTRYHCDQLETEWMVNPLLELDFVVIGDVRPSSARYYDQQCLVEGLIGTLPSYQDGDSLYLDASVISAISRYISEETPELIPSEVGWNLVYKEVENLGYHALASGSFFGFPALTVPETVWVTAYVWVQARDTNDQRGLVDESTWHLLPLVEDEGWAYVILPSWHLVPIYVYVPDSDRGRFSGCLFPEGALVCLGQTPQEFWSVGNDQRYAPGIYYH